MVVGEGHRQQDDRRRKFVGEEHQQRRGQATKFVGEDTNKCGGEYEFKGSG